MHLVSVAQSSCNYAVKVVKENLLSFYFFLCWIKTKESRLNVKHSQTVYDRNVHAVTEMIPPIKNLEYIQVYKYILTHSLPAF